MVLAQYMFTNFGTPPSVVAAMSDREQELCWQWAEREMKARPKR